MRRGAVDPIAAGLFAWLALSAGSSSHRLCGQLALLLLALRLAWAAWLAVLVRYDWRRYHDPAVLALPTVHDIVGDVMARALAGAVHAYLQVVQGRRRRRGSHGARGDGRQPGTAGRESASWTRSVPFSEPGRRGFSCPCGFLDPPGVPGRAAGPSALERRGALAHIKKTRSPLVCYVFIRTRDSSAA